MNFRHNIACETRMMYKCFIAPTISQAMVTTLCSIMTGPAWFFVLYLKRIWSPWPLFGLKLASLLISHYHPNYSFYKFWKLYAISRLHIFNKNEVSSWKLYWDDLSFSHKKGKKLCSFLPSNICMYTLLLSIFKDVFDRLLIR